MECWRYRSGVSMQPSYYLLSRAELAYRKAANAAKNHKNETAIRQRTKTAPGIYI